MVAPRCHAGSGGITAAARYRCPMTARAGTISLAAAPALSGLAPARIVMPRCARAPARWSGATNQSAGKRLPGSSGDGLGSIRPRDTRAPHAAWMAPEGPGGRGGPQPHDDQPHRTGDGRLRARSRSRSSRQRIGRDRGSASQRTAKHSTASSMARTPGSSTWSRANCGRLGGRSCSRRRSSFAASGVRSMCSPGMPRPEWCS